MLQDALSARICSMAELSERLDNHGLTLLHVAAMRDNKECVGALLDAGFNVKTKSSAGWLPYQEAANYRYFNNSKRFRVPVNDVLPQKVLEPDLQFSWSAELLVLNASEGFPRTSRHMQSGSKLRLPAACM